MNGCYVYSSGALLPNGGGGNSLSPINFHIIYFSRLKNSNTFYSIATIILTIPPPPSINFTKRRPSYLTFDIQYVHLRHLLNSTWIEESRMWLQTYTGH